MGLWQWDFPFRLSQAAPVVGRHHTAPHRPGQAIGGAFRAFPSLRTGAQALLQLAVDPNQEKGPRQPHSHPKEQARGHGTGRWGIARG